MVTNDDREHRSKADYMRRTLVLALVIIASTLIGLASLFLRLDKYSRQQIKNVRREVKTEVKAMQSDLDDIKGAVGIIEKDVEK